jgi:hypothetical protein
VFRRIPYLEFLLDHHRYPGVFTVFLSSSRILEIDQSRSLYNSLQLAKYKPSHLIQCKTTTAVDTENEKSLRYTIIFNSDKSNLSYHTLEFNREKIKEARRMTCSDDISSNMNVLLTELSPS